MQEKLESFENKAEMVLPGHLNRIKISSTIKASLFEHIFSNIPLKTGNINYERRQYPRLFVNPGNARMEVKSASQAISFFGNIYHFQSFFHLNCKMCFFLIEILQNSIQLLCKYVNENRIIEYLLIWIRCNNYFHIIQPQQQRTWQQRWCMNSHFFRNKLQI